MIIGLIIVAVCFYAAGHAIERARNQAWTGPRTPAMRTRATRPARAPQGRARGSSSGPGAWNMWNQAWSSNWLEGRQHRRANGTTPAARPARQPRSVIRLRPRTVTRPPDRDPPPMPPDDGNGDPARRCGCGRLLSGGMCMGCGRHPAACTCDQPQHTPPPPPPPAQQPPPPDSTTNGGTMTTGTSNAAGEKIVEGANELHQHASSGGINAKLEALAGAEEGANRFSGTMEMLGRTMSEPDNRYGPEITEPIIKAGAQLRAAAILIGEGRANLESLANMTLRDVAGSPRQAPHHSEMDENGSR